jgi:shikimate dehydrogenase
VNPADPRRRVGLIGHPVGHSISPRFQQAAFDHLGIRARYELWDTSEAELPGRVDGLRRADALGANATIPHKQAIPALADERAPDVELTGAANTLVNDGGRLLAYNTDVGGFLRALANELGYAVRGKRVTVLGAGGAARAVVVALAREDAESIVVLNRSEDRADALVTELSRALQVPLQAGPLDGSAGVSMAGCELVINCTSVGLAGTPLASALPVDVGLLPAGATVVDVVANPLVTPFLAAAAGRGHATLGGLPMRVHQGALAFELWTGGEAPLAVMMAAARAAMTGEPAAVAERAD